METRPDIGRTHSRSVTLSSSAPHAIEWTAEEIARGGVVAIPTDTVYGIATSLAYADSIERVFAIKGRDPERKLPILLSSVQSLAHVTDEVESRQLLMIDEFWPGPVTFIVPTSKSLPERVLSPNRTIAVRVPNHPLAIEVIEKAGGAVACTSANRSDELPALRASDVEATIGSELDLILDGGVAPGGVSSTIVSIEHGTVAILRPGPVDETVIRRAWETYVERV